MAEKIFLGDTAIVQADIFGDDNGLTPEYPQEVTWELSDPNGTRLIFPTLPVTTIDGDIIILSANYGGFNAWDEVQFTGGNWFKIGQAYNSLDNYQATLTIPGGVTDIPGVYKALVHFTLQGPVRKSQVITFEAIDGLGSSTETPEDLAIDRSWLKLEDCFDSSLGGPWLRDMTMNNFSRQKMSKLAPDAMYRINYGYYPVTSFTEASFDYDHDGPLFSQALLVETIYHLMRSYVEQPSPDGNPVTWFNRRDYLARWQGILEIEEKKFNNWLDTWKTQFFGFGAGAMLIGGYASTALRAPRALRTRMPRYSAGMYRRW